jgi:hypothetical protein
MTKETELTFYRWLTGASVVVIGGVIGWFGTRMQANTDAVQELRKDVAVLLYRTGESQETAKEITTRQNDLDSRVAKLESRR